MTETLPSGRLRKLDSSQDLDTVANLVEESFNLKDDPDGSPVVEQMRRLAGQYRNVPRGFPMPTGQQGFVWEDAGKIVGNISLIPFHHGLHLYYLIANVAVEPEHRGQGIAKALTRHALRVARQFGRREIWLQVRSDNRSAIQMYEHLGFRFQHAISQWQKAASSVPEIQSPILLPEHFHFAKRDFTQWYFQERWLQGSYPESTRWYLNVDLRDFSPWVVLNPFKWEMRERLFHFSLTDREMLKGLLTWQRTQTRSDYLWLALPQDDDENWVGKAILQVFLSREWEGKRILAEYPRDRMRNGFEDAGFKRLRDLDWMGIK